MKKSFLRIVSMAVSACLLLTAVSIPTAITAFAEDTTNTVYKDDFENGIGDWVFSDGSATVSDGKLNLVTGANETAGYGDNLISRPMTEARTNQSVTVEVTCAELAAGKLPALWLRVQEDANGVKSGYVLSYDKSSHQYGIWIIDTEGNKNLVSGGIVAINYSYFSGTAKDDTYRVTFSATGTNPTVLSIHSEFETINWPNDYTTASDSTALYQNAGTVGLSAISATENDVIALDNFKYTSTDVYTDINSSDSFDSADGLSDWVFAENGASISDGKLNITTGTNATAGYLENLVTRKGNEARTDQTVTVQVSNDDIAAGRIPAIWLRVQEDLDGNKYGYALIYDKNSNYFGIWKMNTSGTRELITGSVFRIAYSYFGGTAGAGDTYNITFSASGTYPTTLSASAYFSKNTSWVLDGSTEDSTAEYQSSGTVGLSAISATENDIMPFESFSYKGTGAITKLVVRDDFQNGIGEWQDPNGLAIPTVADGKMQITVSGAKSVSDYYVRRPMSEAGINQTVTVNVNAEELDAGSWPVLFLRVQNSDTTSPVGYYMMWDCSGGTVGVGKSVANSNGTITYTLLDYVSNFRKVASANIFTYTFTATGDGKTTNLTATVKQWNTETDYVWENGITLEGDTTASLQGAGTVALSGLEKATAETNSLKYDEFTYIMDDSSLNAKEEEPDEIVIDYSEYINYRQSLANTYSKLTNDKKLNVAYFGGSVTHGTGASDPELYSWRARVGNWFVENFPDAEINNMSLAAGESGTYLGSFRLERDVISAQPDLLFVEYSINDYYAHATYERAASQYETVVRKVKQALPECDIVCVLVTDKNLLNAARKGTLHTQAQAHEDISALYNIPTIHVGRAIASIFSDGWTDSDWLEYSTDIVHVNDKGYEIYYNVIKEFLNHSLIETEYDGNITIPELPALQCESLLDGNVRVIQPSAELLARSEELGATGFEFYDIKYGSMYSESYWYQGTFKGLAENDAELAIEFEGTELVAHLTVTDSSKQFYVKVDNGEYELKNFASLNPTTIVADLPTGKHTVYFKPNYTESFDGLWIGAFFSRDKAMQTAKHDGVTDLRDLVRLKKYKAGMDVVIGSHMDYDNDSAITSADLVALRKILINTVTAPEETPAIDYNRIICWGDSLTRGMSMPKGNKYPDYLQNLIGDEYTVINAGSSGEKSHTIAARQGALKAFVGNDIVFPAGATSVEIGKGLECGLVLEDGTALDINPFNEAFNYELPANILTINGVEYTFSVSNQIFKLTRSYSNKELTIPQGTEVTFSSAKNQVGSYCEVFYIGANDTVETDDDVKRIIEINKAMATRQGNDCYLVIITNHLSQYAEDYVEVFGDRAIDICTEMCKQERLVSVGIEPTEIDLEMMAEGKIPASLRLNNSQTDVHFNEYGYEILANIVYERGKELGYWN